MHKLEKKSNGKQKKKKIEYPNIKMSYWLKNIIRRTTVETILKNTFRKEGVPAFSSNSSNAYYIKLL